MLSGARWAPSLAQYRVGKLGDPRSRRPRVLMSEPAEPLMAADRSLGLWAEVISSDG